MKDNLIQIEQVAQNHNTKYVIFSAHKSVSNGPDGPIRKTRFFFNVGDLVQLIQI